MKKKQGERIKYFIDSILKDEELSLIHILFSPQFLEMNAVTSWKPTIKKNLKSRAST